MSTRHNLAAIRRTPHKRYTITSIIAWTLANPVFVATSEPMQLPVSAVTARMEQEDPKEVPISLSVISGEQLRRQRLDTLESALRNTSGVSVNSSGGPNDFNVMIRGVGSLYQMSMDDSSVAFNIDGVPVSSRSLGFETLDVDRIEVLKGPQGTLSGAIGQAGAVNITTRQPTRELEGYVRGEVGQQGQFLTEGAVGGPISESLSARLAVRRAGYDSWIDNEQTHRPITKPRNEAYRASVLWDLNDDTLVLFSAERQKTERATNTLVLRPYGSDPGLDLTPGLFDDNYKTTERYAIKVDHDFANSRLTSTTATSTADFEGLVAYDSKLMGALYGTPSEYWAVDQSFERSWSQDLHLSSLPDADVFWVAGLTASRNERSYDTPRDTYGTSSAKLRDFTTRTYAGYGEITFPLTERLKLTTGYRHSWDRKTYDGRYFTGPDALEDSRKLTDNYSTGRAALSYALTAQTNVYVQLARGYKSGGFNDYAAQVSDSEPYKAAVSKTAELGFKSETGDRRGSLNGALFYTRVHDDHLLGYNAATFATNAFNADTRTRGAELEGTWHFDERLTLSASVTYLDAKITSAVSGIQAGDIAAGNSTPDVPRWSGNFNATWKQPLGSMASLGETTLNTSVNYRLVGGRAADPQNHFNLDNYEKLDLRAGLESKFGEVYAFADNLLNQTYDTYGFYSEPVAYGAPARRRTLGVGYTYQF
ncbi:TonB-dependent receptor [Pseudomonas fluorescens]|nr:TonB-dependent receptor [Pseudomonas fluorescens]MBT2297507.1 TonB-dependent receptor [Pseudomonas fluorescens]MBT2305705.1 TonB-dependent receptor [Pseudomonas fluorescens]MBT2314272.1 TonB-dependent receptor [Pseudomonas fluorescens]MBT2319236.1 TonB-dependent receptor [Pseudomonas fluorescens]MBT2346639.1 TonB-dependent receptor [Pseudomonas fluorescens]